MRLFEKHYEPAARKVPAMGWEEYVRISGAEFKHLLNEAADDETAFQAFFERNPAYVPGGCDLDDGSGHLPHPHALITQPSLQGIFERIPDFVWLASYTATFHPILVEIEAPVKLCFRSNRAYSREIHQALEQLQHWRMWMEEPSHRAVFLSRFHLTGTYLAENRFTPKYLLLYGRRGELEHDGAKRKLREQLTDSTMQIRSYDGLVPSHKCKDCFTVRLTEQGYEAVEVMPTLQICPCCADGYALISGKERVIARNRYITDERKQFLIERFRYWDNWTRTTPLRQRGSFDSSDVE